MDKATVYVILVCCYGLGVLYMLVVYVGSMRSVVKAARAAHQPWRAGLLFASVICIFAALMWPVLSTIVWLLHGPRLRRPV